MRLHDAEGETPGGDGSPREHWPLSRLISGPEVWILEGSKALKSGYPSSAPAI
jgi:hypothetical protein